MHGTAAGRIGSGSRIECVENTCGRIGESRRWRAIAHGGFLDGQKRICEAVAHKNRTIVEIKRAVITAAGKNQRMLPLQSLVDRDGAAKTALAIIVEEVLSAGIDEICVVVLPGDQAAYTAAAGKHASRLEFV